MAAPRGPTLRLMTARLQTGFAQALKESEIEEATKKKMEKMEILRNKVKAIARMQRIFSNLRYYLTFSSYDLNRTHNDLLITLKHQSVDGKIPRGLLLGGSVAIQEFRLAR